MGKTLIRVDCVDQRLYVSDAPAVASGGRNEDQIEFNFCPMWDGFEKVAVFRRKELPQPYASVIDSEGRCDVPWEVLVDKGWIRFNVVGMKGDATRTSENLNYHVREGGTIDGAHPSDPTPDIYAQYIARIQAIEQMVTSEPFSVTGNPVEIDNYGSAPMHVKTTVALNQSGEGDPSSAKPRPISVVDRFILTHTGADSENKHMSAPVGNMAEGTFDFSTGQMVTTMVWQEFDGSADEKIEMNTDAGYKRGYNFSITLGGVADRDKRSQSRCNLAQYVVNEFKNFDYDTYSISAGGTLLNILPGDTFKLPDGFVLNTNMSSADEQPAVDAFRIWLADNPLQIAYIPAEIITANKVPTPIYAFDGLNTISVNHGTLTVEGEKSLPAAVGGLSERVTELEENSGSVGGAWISGVSSIEGKDGDLTLKDIGAQAAFEVGEGLTMADGVLSASEGVWEEIEVYELPESSQGPIDRSADLNGIQYNFKRLRIEMALSKGNVGQVVVMVGLSDKTNKITVQLPNAMSAEKALYNGVYLDIRNGALEVTGIQGAPGSTVLVEQLAYPTLYTTEGTITSITIVSTTAMGAGSLFRIKAVRA